jgi:HSP20 family molecular chaperone IbpA
MPKGFEGLVRGLGDLLQIASDLAERTDRTVDHNGIFGVSVRVNRGPVVSRVGRVSRHGSTSAGDVREAVADVFDEDDHYLVVAEFPGVAESAVHWTIRDGEAVVVRATADGRTYAKDIALASRVDASTAAARYGNGVLELRVWKQQPR